MMAKKRSDYRMTCSYDTWDVPAGNLLLIAIEAMAI